MLARRRGRFGERISHVVIQMRRTVKVTGFVEVMGSGYQLETGRFIRHVLLRILLSWSRGWGRAVSVGGLVCMGSGSPKV